MKERKDEMEGKENGSSRKNKWESRVVLKIRVVVNILRPGEAAMTGPFHSFHQS
jgi:hypothetical protein